MKISLRPLLLGALALSLIPGIAAADSTFDDEERMKRQIAMANATPISPDKDSSGSATFGTVKPMAPIGTYPTRKGVILVTSDSFKGLIPTGHAGIVYSKYKTVESVESGVQLLDNNWKSTKIQAYGVTVKGLSAAQDAKAADWAYNQIGKPYNLNYLNRDTRSKFYCSQLVWAAFKDNFGIDLDTWEWGTAIHPMELVNTPLTRTIWRKK